MLKRAAARAPPALGQRAATPARPRAEPIRAPANPDRATRARPLINRRPRNASLRRVVAAPIPAAAARREAAAAAPWAAEARAPAAPARRARRGAGPQASGRK